MTTALEHALQLEQEKFAAENGGQQNLTPMQQGYMDAMSKLGYEIKGAADYTRKGMAAMDPAKRQALVGAQKKKMQPTFKSQVQKAKGTAASIPAPTPRSVFK